MPLDLNTSTEFLKRRVDATLAVQRSIAATWLWPLRSLAEWADDSLQLDRSQETSLAHAALAASTLADRARGTLDARLNAIHAQTNRVVGVMRARAARDAGLGHVVDELSARGGSRKTIEDEGTALLSAWKEEFGGAGFLPVPAMGGQPAVTFESFRALLFGAPAAGGTPAVSSLRDFKQALSDAATVERRAVGRLNVLLNRAEKDAQDWYAEATSVFPANTEVGDLVRGIPTTADYNPPTPAAPAAPTP